MVSLLFGLPGLVELLSWSSASTANSNPEKIGKGAELIARAAVPWWVGVFLAWFNEGETM